jgi:hypothetical protein
VSVPVLGNAHHSKRDLIVNYRAKQLDAKDFNAVHPLAVETGTQCAITPYAMKHKGLALSVTLSVLICPFSFSAEINDEAAPQPVTQNNPTDTVAELRNQDSVFSILIEAFRQVQGRVIQTDYEVRITAANALNDLKTRRRVVELANEERDLRVKKLYHQIGNLCATYDTTRHDDERVANVEVPVNIDTGHAAKTLMDYVFIAPAPSDNSGEKKTQTIPASNYLLDKLPDPVE